MIRSFQCFNVHHFHCRRVKRFNFLFRSYSFLSPRSIDKTFSATWNHSHKLLELTRALTVLEPKKRVSVHNLDHKQQCCAINRWIGQSSYRLTNSEVNGFKYILLFFRQIPISDDGFVVWFVVCALLLILICRVHNRLF